MKDRPELIGQFGVGFYSSFMVADRVTVLSRAGRPEVDGVQVGIRRPGRVYGRAVEKETRGTDVILHLREEQGFPRPWRCARSSSSIPTSSSTRSSSTSKPRRTGRRSSTEDTLNSRKAIWLRPKSEIKSEDYNAFYRQITPDMDDPARVIHFAAEGQVEFRALLYLPKHRPLEFLWREPRSAIQLYVRRVLIMHDCPDLLPTWLRFVRGVVDSADLPLNVSREMLQHNAVLTKIRQNLVNRVLKTLEEMKVAGTGGPPVVSSGTGGPPVSEDYLTFHSEFGQILKEGVTQDWTNRERIADLLLFQSTKTEPGKYTTLAQYVEGMNPDQQEILYLVGESRAAIEHSPYLESAKAADQEVLLLTEPIDEFVAENVGEYKGKRLRGVDRATATDAKPPEAGEFAALLATMKSKLPEVKDVRLSAPQGKRRLPRRRRAWPIGPPGALMEQMGRRDLPPVQRIIELNAQHPAVVAMKKLHDRDAKTAPRGFLPAAL